MIRSQFDSKLLSVFSTLDSVFQQIDTLDVNCCANY